MERSVVFGKIVATHGVKGAFVAEVYFDNPENYILKNKIFYYQKLIPLTILGRKPQDKLILTSPLIDTVEKAKLMVGKNLHCKRSQMQHEQKPGEYLVADLVGLVVYSQSHDKILGKVKDVISYSGDILLEIEIENTKSNTVTQQYVIFSDKYIEDVNIERRYIVLKHNDDIIEG